jgi:hypothetical protein
MVGQLDSGFDSADLIVFAIITTIVIIILKGKAVPVFFN